MEMEKMEEMAEKQELEELQVFWGLRQRVRINLYFT